MTETNVCPECGADRPADAPRGPCPRCRAGEAVTGLHEAAPRAAERPRGPHPPTFSEFKRAVVEMGMVGSAELDRIAADEFVEVSRLARALVRAGKLTAYQAAALSQGKARGLVIGNYLVLDKLGRGGMGVVFKARRRGSGRVVALKILPPSFGRDRDAVLRFRREYEIAAGLSHPNVVSAIDADEDRGVQFLTMEFIDGHNLDELVREVGALPIKLALHCVIQAARGLEAAHTQGIVHRDIKPGNLMLDATGAVRVLDLGLARVVEAAGPFGTSGDGDGPAETRTQVHNLTRSGVYMGTVDFIAPEQIDDSRRADHRADIYSLGCTLFFLLTGRPPFTGEGVLKRLLAHQDRPAPSLLAARPDAPAPLEGVFQAMMAKSPADRPRSMAEVAALLETCRSSADEAREARSGLKKAYAETVLKLASPLRAGRGHDGGGDRGPSEPPRGGGSGAAALDLDLGLDLLPEDVVTEFRAEGTRRAQPAAAPVPPPTGPAGVPPARRRSPVPLALGAIVLLGLGPAGYALFRRPGAEAVAVVASAEPRSPERAAAAVPAVTPGKDRLVPPAESETTESPPSPPAVVPPPSPPAAPAEPVSSPGRVIFADDFGDPATGWGRDDLPMGEGQKPMRRNYENGAYYLEAPGAFRGASAWDCAGPVAADFQFEAVGRVLGEGDVTEGAWGLIVSGPGPRGFQVSIDRRGRVAVDRAFWGEKAYPKDPHFVPVTHPAVRRGDQWNTLTLRVRKRGLVVLVNGVAVCAPHNVGWDLTPATPQIFVLKPAYGAQVRAEFDRVEGRELAPDPEPPPAPAAPPLVRLLYADDFSDPASGWPRGQPEDPDFYSDYREGVYFLEARHDGFWGWNFDRVDEPEYACQAVGRVQVGPEARGAWGLMIRSDDRRVLASIDGAGRLLVQSSRDGEDSPVVPFVHRAIRPGNESNTLTLYVRKRRLEILVNAARVCDPIPFDWDLTPSTPQLFVSSEAGRVRAEFDRVEVKDAPPPQARRAAKAK